MGRQAKIQKYRLEEFVVGLRRHAKTVAEMATAINDELLFRGINDTVTTRAVERYLASLDAHTVAVAHQPQVAQQNAQVIFDVAGRLGILDEKLVRWIDQADLAVRPVQGVVYDLIGQRVIDPDELGAQRGGDPDDEDEDDLPIAQLYEIDWQARKAAAGELRQACVATADLLARIHDAEQVKAFQESFLEAIAEVDPAVAAAVLENLAKKQSIVRASLLGATA